MYLRISPDGRLLAWVDDAFSVCLWDLENNREIPFPGPRLMLGWHNLAFYPDSDHLTFGTAKGMVETWEDAPLRRVSALGEGHTSPPARTAGGWRPRGFLDGPPMEFPIGIAGFTLPQESGPIWSLAWSPDGEHLAVGLADGGLAIWILAQDPGRTQPIGLAWRTDARPATAAGAPAFVTRDAP